MKNKINILFLLIGILIQACSNNEEAKVEKEYSDPPLTQAEKQEYIKAGGVIAKTTFIQLSSTLKRKIEEGGIQNAIGYCNLAAYPLTDSIAKANNAYVKRVSDRYRNPDNKANDQEIQIIAAYKEAKVKGNKLQPQVIQDEGQIHFYAPIETKGLCLSCHGEPGKFISEADYAFIKEKYPNDLAINYNTGDLRGIWSITFLE